MGNNTDLLGIWGGSDTEVDGSAPLRHKGLCYCCFYYCQQPWWEAPKASHWVIYDQFWELGVSCFTKNGTCLAKTSLVFSIPFKAMHC